MSSPDTTVGPTPPVYGSPPPPPPPDPGGPGGSLVGPISVAVLLVVIVTLDVLTFYGIWTFWPSENAKGGKTVHIFGLSRTVSRETMFFVIVALSGALGGSVHAVRSMGWYIGNRSLKWSWAPFYVLRPLVGATLATVFYFVLRAGLFSPSSQTSATSPYGFAGVAALVGLFSEQAVEKLKAVAEQFFQEAPKGLDPAPTADQTGTPTPAGSAAVTGPPTAQTSSSATVGGIATAAAAPVSYRFEYGQDINYGSATQDQALAPNTTGVPVSAVLTGLAPGTIYHYRLVVTDNSGSSLGADAILQTTS